MELKQRVVDDDAMLDMMAGGLTNFWASIYASRGIKAKEQLNPVGSLLTDNLMGLTAAVDRLSLAVRRGEPMCIVADYDCDGATSCSILYAGLQALGANIQYLVPNRMVHGYGLTPSIVKLAATLAVRPTLLVTVDNGIASIEGVAEAVKSGMEVVVTDHHLPMAGGLLPAAVAIVNPNQNGCSFESKALAGCGVSWYVLKALHAVLAPISDKAAQFDPQALLPLVALGTVADVVPLDDNNRRLIWLGLQRLKTNPYEFPGVARLAGVAKKNLASLSTADIGFGLGPRINAAGRLADMTLGIQLLTTHDDAQAIELATELNSFNEDRKAIEGEMLDAAVAQVLGQVDAGVAGIALTGHGFHEGVVGVVAGRIKEQLHRPVFVFSEENEDGHSKGSGRSIPGVHLRDVLDWVSKQDSTVLVKFGGHAMAAGATIHANKFAQFSKLFAEGVALFAESDDIFHKVLWTDGSLELSSANTATADDIATKVWGQGFPEPLFCDEFEVRQQKLMGANSEHSKFILARGNQLFDAVWFRSSEVMPATIRAAYKLSVNEFRGERKLQLMIEYAEKS